MTWIELGNPVPHNAPRAYTPFVWPDGDVEQLIEPILTNQSFVHVLGARRTQRTFGPLPGRDLSALLWLSCRVLLSQESDLGYSLSLRPTPSAGAIHCLHVLLREAGSPYWRRYNPINHALAQVTANGPNWAELRAAVGEVLDPAGGTIVQFVAEPGKVAAKYDNPSSLIWRDAGALITHLGLAASYLGLNFCALGIDGDTWSSVLDPGRRLAGVGVALVGAPA